MSRPALTLHINPVLNPREHQFKLLQGSLVRALDDLNTLSLHCRGGNREIAVMARQRIDAALRIAYALAGDTSEAPIAAATPEAHP